MMTNTALMDFDVPFFMVIGSLTTGGGSPSDNLTSDFLFFIVKQTQSVLSTLPHPLFTLPRH